MSVPEIQQQHAVLIFHCNNSHTKMKSKSVYLSRTEEPTRRVFREFNILLLSIYCLQKIFGVQCRTRMNQAPDLCTSKSSVQIVTHLGRRSGDTARD